MSLPVFCVSNMFLLNLKLELNLALENVFFISKKLVNYIRGNFSRHLEILFLTNMELQSNYYQSRYEKILNFLKYIEIKVSFF